MTHGTLTNGTFRFLIASLCFGGVFLSNGGILSNAAAFAQFDEAAELPKGLLARYSVGEHSVEKLEEVISYNWGNSSPDRRLGKTDEPFKGQWQSQLLIRQAGQHQLHAFVHGNVRVEINGSVILDTNSQTAGWVSGDKFTPDIGFQEFLVRFEKTEDQARLQLFWSSETFPLEPLPGHLFFREEGRPDLALIELGRNQFEAFRCGACHKHIIPESEQLSAPDLTRSVAGLSTDWIVKKLTGHEPGKMPHFDLSNAQATTIAAALASSTEKPELDSLPKPGKGRNADNDREAGLTLINSLGCLACHTTEPDSDSVTTETQTEALLFGGGSLADVGNKRSAEWFNTWLRNPESLNRSHRMPVFKLTSQERRQLALGLAALGTNGKAPPSVKAPSTSDNIVRQGKQLIHDLGCRSCHVVAAKKTELTPQFPSLVSGSKKQADWKKSCVRDSPKSNGKPSQPAFEQVAHEALKAFVDSISQNAAQPTVSDNGHRLLVSRNCTACHPRGLRQGLAATAGEIATTDAALRGQAPSLVPPNLNALGDRLLDDALEKAVSGEQKRRMDWKLVRMPEFKHSDADRQALTEYFINSDRIPGNAPTWDVKDDDSKVSDQTLVIGQELVGPKGFSCIACHQVGDYVPKKAAMGTRGSDLVGLGNRMRHSYFVRWTRSPLRIVPGVEMPSYTKAVHGVLGDDANAQLEALWKTLADPRFEPPTDPAAVEQYVIVKKGAAPRLIRDVFTNPEENGGGYISRAFAIGFENGHNVLLDLNDLTLRRWTYGDFARQRTVGKSWYWDLAGSDIIAINKAYPEFALVRKGTPKEHVVDSAIFPRKTFGTTGRLLAYGPHDSLFNVAKKNAEHDRSKTEAGAVISEDTVSLRYRMNFEIDGQPVAMDIVRKFETSGDVLTNERNSGSGWVEVISTSNIPDGFDLLHFPVSIPADPNSLGTPKVTHVSDGSIFEVFKNAKVKQSATSVSAIRIHSEFGTASIRNVRITSLRRPSLDVTLKPLPPAKAHKITSVPGFEGTQLPVSTKIMPTAMTVLNNGSLAFTSLEGHIYIAKDTDSDGVEDELTMFEEGLSAPYGIIQDGDSLLVSHKPEILRLRDTDGDGRADERTVFSSGWGFNDNYHDWTCGIAKDAKGNFYVGLGSDYAQLKRPKDVSRWRGKVLQISPDGTPRPFAHAFRYPTGIAIDGKGNVFCTDNQGVQNTFNELNHLRDGFHFGVPKNHEQSLKVKAHAPAIQIPHPWTRSINGITFLPEDYPQQGIAGDGVGCEFNGKHLIRFTHHEVDGILQGATYFLSKPDFPDADANFLGPLSITTAPNGDIYIGSIHDSGWLGGQNTGSIVKLTPSRDLPNGIKKIQATAYGFEIQFQKPVDRTAAENPKSYSLSGYTREWKGGYATPDSGRFQPKVRSAELSADSKIVRVKTSELKTGFVYEINCLIKKNDTPLWPATGHYTLHRIPGGSSQ